MLGAHTVTDPHIASFVVESGEQSRFLQTSPEFAMKKLLAHDSGPIYNLGPAFRSGEIGGHHSPEFTMLEWYRPGFDLGQLQLEVSSLIEYLGQHFALDIPEPLIASYSSLFKQRFSINPHIADTQALKSIIAAVFPDHSGHLEGYLEGQDEGEKDDLLDLLFALGIEPTLQAPQFVTGFPESQASLARVGTEAGDRVALRAELYWQGIELANGYDELRDGNELRTRMARDNRIRLARGLPQIAPDEALLEALPKIPPCAGIALGVDRLLMLLLAKRQLADVL
ncbi:MAG: lysyl-tRNA synthetase class 2 [Candidatus Azotimanducaceae bacterium]